MNPESELDQIRRDFQVRQRNLLPGDGLRISVAAESSPWNRNSKKRSGQLFVAVVFLLLAIAIVAIPLLEDFEDGTIVAFIVALGPVFMSYLLIRDSILHHGNRTQDRK